MTRRASLRVRHAGSGHSLGDAIEIADRFLPRLVGLLGRPGLEPGHGIWFPGCRAIHMFFMRFAIDVIFLDDDLRVTKLYPDLAPWRIARGDRRATSVLELPIGTIRSSQTRVGDVLEFDRG
jgi:uncharacterized protein